MYTSILAHVDNTQLTSHSIHNTRAPSLYSIPSPPPFHHPPHQSIHPNPPPQKPPSTLNKHDYIPSYLHPIPLSAHSLLLKPLLEELTLAEAGILAPILVALITYSDFFHMDGHEGEEMGVITIVMEVTFKRERGAGGLDTICGRDSVGDSTLCSHCSRISRKSRGRAYCVGENEIFNTISDAITLQLPPTMPSFTP